MNGFSLCRCKHYHGSRLECSECEAAGDYCHYSVPAYMAPTRYETGSPEWERTVVSWLLFCCVIGLLVVMAVQHERTPPVCAEKVENPK